MITAAATSWLPQVFELNPGMDSGGVWQEVSLLRRCSHKRIVPLLGVAIKVRCCRFPCAAGLRVIWVVLRWVACLLVCLLACLSRAIPRKHVVPAGGMAGPGCAAVLHAGSIQSILHPPLPPRPLPAEPAAASSNGVHAWRQPASRAAAAGVALGSQVGGWTTNVAELSCPALPCAAPSLLITGLSSQGPQPCLKCRESPVFMPLLAQGTPGSA